MPFSLSSQQKVGLFVLFVLLILAYATVRISQSSLIPGSTYPIYLIVDSATAITNKTPVQIAGVHVGWVQKISLNKKNRAQLELAIKNEVKISKNVQVRIKTLGFLGDTYIELFQPGMVTEILDQKAIIDDVKSYGDFNSVTAQVGDIASDIKAVTATLKTLMAGDDSSFARSLKNIEKITNALSNVTTSREEDLKVIISNLRAISENLNGIVARNRGNVDATLENVAVITDKVKRGEGTIGRLVNDEETVEKLNESIDSLNNLLGGASKLQVGLGFHSEYLGTSKDFKNYVSFSLKPRPDKYFLFELVDDPAPTPSRTTRETTITSNGQTSTVTEDIETIAHNKFRLSAQFAKKLYNFTLRGGLIESTGGAGVDYGYGPLGLKFSAFDFQSENGRKPHLKAMGTVNITKSFYLLGGLDDFISREQDPDWFMGAGIQFTDDDLKSLIGLTQLTR